MASRDDVTTLVEEAEQLLLEVETVRREDVSYRLFGLCERLRSILLSLDGHIDRAQAQVAAPTNLHSQIAQMHKRLEHVLEEARPRTDVDGSR